MIAVTIRYLGECCKASQREAGGIVVKGKGHCKDVIKRDAASGDEHGTEGRRMSQTMKRSA
jgi:hypothetical protein